MPAGPKQTKMVSLRLTEAELRDLDAVCKAARLRTGDPVTRGETMREMIRKGVAELVRQDRRAAGAPTR
jgi:hypothetical protein